MGDGGDGVAEGAVDESATAALRGHLDLVWRDDPEGCVRLILQLGAAREGKQDRWNFYDVPCMPPSRRKPPGKEVHASPP